MTLSPVDPVLPIVIVPLDSGKEPEPRREEPPDLLHWQIEEFLRQTEKGCVAKTEGVVKQRACVQCAIALHV